VAEAPPERDVAVEAPEAPGPLGPAEALAVVLGAAYCLGPWRVLAADVPAFALGALLLALGPGAWRPAAPAGGRPAQVGFLLATGSAGSAERRSARSGSSRRRRPSTCPSPFSSST